MREVATWSKLKKEFHDNHFDDKDGDSHQAESYKLQLQHRAITKTAGTSQAEVFNIVGQVDTLNRVIASGELTKPKENKKLNRKKYNEVRLCLSRSDSFKIRSTSRSICWS
jgi:hypothetical protein